MSAETLLSAARRVVRFFNIDMNGGGLMTVDTQQAVETLDRMVRAADAAARRQEAEAARRQAEVETIP